MKTKTMELAISSILWEKFPTKLVNVSVYTLKNNFQEFQMEIKHRVKYLIHSS